uniref:PSI_integrin domain-containing protein n=1 Tax=Caenorhabditis tropicalis TaxID=1561998 RepID=A0A1I7T5L3_9PELO
MRISIIVFLSSLALVTGESTAKELCGSSDAQQSCGQCIKAHTECAWCIDPHSFLINRCQPKSQFTNETCTPHLVYSPQTAQIKTQQNLPLETKQHDGKTIVRLQPQAVSVRLMPGHSATVSFKYLHQSDVNRKSAEPETMEIQTSDVRESPLALKFSILEWKETKSCKVQNNQIVEFKIEEQEPKIEDSVPEERTSTEDSEPATTETMFTDEELEKALDDSSKTDAKTSASVQIFNIFSSLLFLAFIP